jgi:poly(A) polymerase
VRWNKRIAAGEPSIQALMEAADSVLDEQTEKLAIQKRFSADMREIWFMQPRFEKRLPKAIWRMFEQPRFRAAVDFLQLRAAAHQFDSVLAQWWMDLANADDEARAVMLEELSRLPRESNATGQRARSRRKRSPRAASSAPRTPPADVS